MRFGSLDYIQESLPASQAGKLNSLMDGLGESSVVSVLVKSPAEDLLSSLPENSVIIRCRIRQAMRADPESVSCFPCEPEMKRCDHKCISTELFSLQKSHTL